MKKRLRKLAGRYKLIDQVLITPYRSYGTHSHLYIKGRVLDNEPLKITQDANIFKTIKTTYKQFDTFEIPDAQVDLSLPGKVQATTQSDDEGFFLFDNNIEQNLAEHADEEGWLDYDIFYKGPLGKKTELLEDPFKGDFLIPDPNAEYGVISDIDDTILHTGVTSFLKLRLLKNSLLTNAYNRIPLKGAAEFYQKLHTGRDGTPNNPIFYLSNSPWNLYEYLKLFLDHNAFPKGPILLRKFRTPFDGSIKPEKPHKQKEIANILKTYPEMNFILIGDSGEHDASIYTEIAAQYPDRILAIYLRSVKHKKQMSRVRSIIDNFETTPVLMVETSQEAVEHAREHGFI
ncbi:phosphatase domain-containing protein [uncultured Salegentibacter sp.]|uniref:App1 family protein n=1 Tax=uncultured Salegentibacter sp. TaxID=259320 RepID=UPI0030DAE0C3|tara:strand:+ start:584 stop:1618 length:1035 start_codon:yes stop_codon:yes gene_type:complete